VRLHAFECGRLELPQAFLLKGARGKITVPVPSYLIEHPKGRVLFDSGLNRLTQSDPEAYITTAGMQYTTFHFEPGEEIAARLESIDLAPTDIDVVVNSHLHYDHCGGNSTLPNADVLVQEPEWAHAESLPDDDVAYRKVDFETGQKVRRVKGEHDLFGDGSVVAIPTYGHTPGHQSLRVRTASGEFVLCGDACYLRHSLDHDHLPGILYDREAALRAFALFRKLEAKGARILFGHDPEFWQSVPKAPARLA
jgi:glyoxylase-like metal-dependent hydrolase (beta-lactamase superfamily II)